MSNKLFFTRTFNLFCNPKLNKTEMEQWSNWGVFRSKTNTENRTICPCFIEWIKVHDWRKAMIRGMNFGSQFTEAVKVDWEIHYSCEWNNLWNASPTNSRRATCVSPLQWTCFKHVPLVHRAPKWLFRKQ